MSLRILVAGNGTDVGKTVVSAILTSLVGGDYWKPIQCGPDLTSDYTTMKKLLDHERHHIFPPRYSLAYPLSPHHAARLQGIEIDIERLTPPKTEKPLIIEGVGGIYVPITTKILSFDLFRTWNAHWIVVSKNELGSINTTLLTLDALKRAIITPLGLIFNGTPNYDSEEAILQFSRLPFLERVIPEKSIDYNTITRYAKQWKNSPSLKRILLSSGIPLRNPS